VKAPNVALTHHTSKSILRKISLFLKKCSPGDGLAWTLMDWYGRAGAGWAN
jgi:hypothetical protein